MKKTIWYNENAGYDCVLDEDFEKYEIIIGFKNTGNCDVSLRIIGFASCNEKINKRRYSFFDDVNLKRGGRDWLKTLERMQEIITKEIDYTKSRIGKDYVPETTRRNYYKNKED